MQLLNESYNVLTLNPINSIQHCCRLFRIFSNEYIQHSETNKIRKLLIILKYTYTVQLPLRSEMQKQLWQISQIFPFQLLNHRQAQTGGTRALETFLAFAKAIILYFFSIGSQLPVGQNMDFHSTNKEPLIIQSSDYLII